MATKRASSKKGSKKGAKKASKKASAKAAAFTIPKIDPACLKKCVEAYRKCLAGGNKPAVCKLRFARCVAGCIKY
ncbi:MAG: hypothetical protein QOD32_3685 [Pyrinomonadaceae bacterium]|jgi:hypothetical protein|nr:hypothetical protein [Pyrinomonadaceae bacterium]